MYHQILKVKWLSWVAFIRTAASEINLTKRIWYNGNFGRKLGFWDHETGGTSKVINLSSHKWNKLWKDAKSKMIHTTFATHTHRRPQNSLLTYSKPNTYSTGDQNLQCYKQNESKYSTIVSYSSWGIHQVKTRHTDCPQICLISPWKRMMLFSWVGGFQRSISQLHNYILGSVRIPTVS